MAINKQIQLNQSNLQDLIDCPRRFQLRTIDQISWPATPGGPISKIEELIEIGIQFHSLCHRFFTGIDPALLSKDIANPELKALWNGFIPIGENLQSQDVFPEIILSSTFSGYKLTAKYDLISLDDTGHFTIYDWKTSANPPSRSTLENRAQTIIYPYLFMVAGPQLYGMQEITPSQVSMRYIYPLASESEIIFEYSDSKLQENYQRIQGWITYLEDLAEAATVFPLTESDLMCQRCGYRSICDRGIKPADASTIDEIDREDLSGTHFDLDQVIEINY